MQAARVACLARYEIEYETLDAIPESESRETLMKTKNNNNLVTA